MTRNDIPPGYNHSTFIFIAYYFPPIHSVAVVRNYQLATALKDTADDFVVFTTSNRNQFMKDGIYSDEFEVQLLNTFDYRTLAAKFSSKKKSIHFAESSKSNPIVKFLVKLNETLPFSLLFGEGGFFYILHGFNKGKKLLKATQGTKYIFTSYRPAANIAIGFLLKKAFPDSVWMTSFHDAPVDSTRKNVFFTDLQHWCYKKVLAVSDLNVSVSEGVASQLKCYSKKQLVVRNGISVRPAEGREKNQKFTLCYTGSMYQVFRNPSLLFSVLEEFLKQKKIDPALLVIQYAGKDSHLWSTFLSSFPALRNCSQIFGEVLHVDSLKLQQQADVNLLLTWSDHHTKGMLTGKLYEYLGSCNPIICLVTGNEKDAELDNIFSELACGIVCYSHDLHAMEDLIRYISALYDKWLESTDQVPYISKVLLDQYSWKNQTKKIISALKDYSE